MTNHQEREHQLWKRNFKDGCAARERLKCTESSRFELGTCCQKTSNLLEKSLFGKYQTVCSLIWQERVWQESRLMLKSISAWHRNCAFSEMRDYCSGPNECHIRILVQFILREPVTWTNSSGPIPVSALTTMIFAHILVISAGTNCFSHRAVLENPLWWYRCTLYS